MPLITDDGTWARTEVFCQFGKQPSGAGSALWTLYAHRSTATSADWTIADLRQDYRVPPCHGPDGLLNQIAPAVVRELRGECNVLGSGNRPQPELYLDIFRNARHRFDDLGPWIDLQAASGRRAGLINIERPARPPTFAAIARDLGRPRRRGCHAHWPHFSLWATACGRDRVTTLTLHAPWALGPTASPSPATR